MAARRSRDLGTPKNGGTRLFCLSGHVNQPGVYELPMGFNLMRMIDEVGGGIRGGKKLKAVIPGGSSCPVLRADECDIAMDYDSLAKAKSMLGIGRRGGDGRGHVHGEGHAAHHAILCARKLRLVHSLPRRDDVAAEDADAHSRGRRAAQRYRI